MMAEAGEVFADTVFWLALVLRRDACHPRAQSWARALSGRIITTWAVLLETANTLAPAAWRHLAVRFVDRLEAHPNVEIVELDSALLRRGWDLYQNRADKDWSLVDCISFIVMGDRGIRDALTADRHFQQAGFRALLLEEPPESA